MLTLLILTLGACASIQQRTPAWLLPGRNPPPATAREGETPVPANPVPEAQRGAPPRFAPPAVTAEGPPNRTPDSELPGAKPGETAAPVKVALLLPLSGPNASVGEAILEAAQMALFDAGRDNLTLLIRDTTGQPEEAAAAADDAIRAGAELILGPLFAAEVQAVTPVAQAAHISVIAFSTDRSVAAPQVYLMGFTPEEQIAVTAKFAVQTGYNRFGVLVPDTPYGRTVEQTLRKTASTLGVSVVKSTSYPPETADFTQIARRFADYDRRKAALAAERQALAERDDETSRQALARLQHHDSFGETAFDALFIPDGGARLRALAPVLAYFDVDPTKVKFLGSGQWDQPGLGSEPALIGGWYAAPPPDIVEAFRNRYEQNYGRKPLRIASLGYDATALAALLSAGPKETRFGATAIGDKRGFAGFDGIFRFGSDAVIERGLAILEVQRNGVKIVRPAPESFESVGE